MLWSASWRVHDVASLGVAACGGHVPLSYVSDCRTHDSLSSLRLLRLHAGKGSRRALRLIGYALAALAIYLLAQSTLVLAAGYHPRHSPLGITWIAVTAAAMFAMAAGKARTGRALGNPVLRTEGRVTLIDAILAVAVLLGLVLNAALGWWRANPAAGYVLVFTPAGKSGRSSQTITHTVTTVARQWPASSTWPTHDWRAPGVSPEMSPDRRQQPTVATSSNL
jgi:hypothetical protein